MQKFPYLSGSRRSKDPRRLHIVRHGYGKSWPKQRARALRRDKYTCLKCGRVGKKEANRYWDVHVHHKRKISWFVNTATKEFDEEAANSLDNLETLCKVCHQVADGHATMQGFVMLK